jgi:hypothetical protein
MKYTRILSLIAAIVLSAQSVAGTMGPVVASWEWVSTLTFGPDFVNPGRIQTLALLPPFQNQLRFQLRILV